MRLRPLALGAIASVAVSTAASAQQAPQLPAVEAGKRQIHADLTVSTEYDSNITRSSTALAQLRGLSKDDVTTDPIATVSAVQPLGQQALFVKGSVGYQFHRKNTRLDRRNYDLSGGGLALVGMCHNMLFGEASGLQSDLVDLDAGTVENFHKTKSIGDNLECGRNIGPFAALTLMRQETKNSAAVQKISDFDSRTAYLTLGYKNPTLGTISAIATVTTVEYPNRINPGRPIGDGFFTRGYGLAVEHNFGSRIHVTAQAARTRLKREFAPPGQPLKLSGSTYDGQVDYKLGSRITIRAEAARNFEPSLRAGKVYDLDKREEIEVRYRLGTRFLVTVGHSLEDKNSNVDTTAVARAIVTRSRTNDTYGSIEYRRGDRFSLALDVRQEDRKTDLPAFNYTATRVGLKAGAGF
jgi:hypothetical protein